MITGRIMDEAQHFKERERKSQKDKKTKDKKVPGPYFGRT